MKENTLIQAMREIYLAIWFPNVILRITLDLNTQMSLTL